MNKQLCFRIEQQDLFLEKTLVLFNDIPLFFICRNENKQRFLALCTELERLDYLVVSTSLPNIRNMLNQKCTMRNAILEGKRFWCVVSGDTVEDDLCETIEKAKIDLNILPEEGAVYRAIFQEDKDYINDIENEYRKDLEFNLIDNGINILVNSADILTENINSVIESISENVSKMEEYFDVGTSIDIMINGIKKIFSNTEIEIEKSNDLVYNFYYKKEKSIVLIKSDTILNGDETTNLAA